jgi:hypothetical protein
LLFYFFHFFNLEKTLITSKAILKLREDLAMTTPKSDFEFTQMDYEEKILMNKIGVEF